MRKLLPAIFVIACNFLIPVCGRAQSTQTVVSGAGTAPIKFTSPGCAYRWTNDNPAIGLPASGTGDIPSFTAINNGRTPVIANIKAVPEDSEFAYIANSGSNNVSVISTATKKVIATVPVGTTPFGVSASADGTKVYITNQGSNSVSVISTASNMVTATIPVGKAPRGVVVSPDGTRLYVANSGDNNVTVIDATTNMPLTTVAVGTEPWGIAITPDGKSVYVANWRSNTVSAINTSSNSIKATIPVVSEPSGVAISPDGSKGYVSNSGINLLTQFSTITNSAIDNFYAGPNPLGLTVSADGTKVYVADTQGYFTIVFINLHQFNSVAAGSTNSVGVTHNGLDFYLVGNIVEITNEAVTSATAPTVGTSPSGFGNFISKGTGCNGATLTCKITVNPSPVVPAITAGTAQGVISACIGSESASPNIQQFTVSGKDLSGSITATAPSKFEVSLNPNSGYGSSVTLNQSGGKVNNTTVYVRSAVSGTAGPITGNVQLSAAGAALQTVAVSGNINALPVVNPVADKEVVNGTPITAINLTGTGNTFTWTNGTPSIGLEAGGTGDIPAFTAINNGTTPVKATISVVAKRLGYVYIPNAIDNTVSVINPADNKLVTTIPVGTEPYGVAVNPAGTRVYVSNILGHNMSVINTQTNAVIATVPTGDHPYGIAVSPNGNRVYVVNEESASVTVVDAASNTVVTTLTVGQYPTFAVVSPDGSRLYVGNQNSESISVFNTGDNSLLTTINIAGHEPSQLATSADGKTLYVVALDNDNSFLVINTLTFAITAKFSVGLTAHALALTPDGSKIYVPNTGANTVSVISTATNAVINTITVGNYPTGVSVTAAGDLAYVVNSDVGSNKGNISVINTATDQVISNFQVGASPVAIGNFINTIAECAGDPMEFTITVDPTPSPLIVAGPVTGQILACEGSASASPYLQQFSVSGTNLTEGITVTPPAGFELSLNPQSSFTAILSIFQTNGVVPNTTVYARSAVSLAAGSHTGAVTLSSAGAANQTVTINGTINSLAAVSQVSNYTFANGATTNPVNFNGTADTFNWINDTPSIGLSGSGTGDILPFTAVNTTANPITATITVTPTNTAGCGGTPITFTITVKPDAPPSLAHLIIPNTFSPNGDGINDTWNIKNLEDFPNATINIFTRWGQKIFSSVGYPLPWDGKFGNTALPVGTYYYVIDNKNGDVVSGWVAIVR